jgi:hypothetical protein
MIKPVLLNVDFNKILNVDYSNNEGSCIKHQVHELKDIHNRFGGFPDSYKYENTIIYQYWWNSDELDFIDIGKQLGIEVVTISSIKQRPGCIVPWHRDTFFQISKKYPNDLRLKVRANIFVEDRKIGHIIEHQGGLISAWKQGQGFMWDSQEEHLGANAGFEDKYTLQISGFLQETV